MDNSFHIPTVNKYLVFAPLMKKWYCQILKKTQGHQLNKYPGNNDSKLTSPVQNHLSSTGIYTTCIIQGDHGSN
ncbi:hypothetical protein GUJ93_ZPchr0060g7192 [Zizania palustris]|uniref:Uncharacterized protein n=1 Tax=Zizania palustris TaxID=103762 RepID=A0A8J5RDG8_ZIZPA|nr:hypothetical protein GUJ93_ZPchr0060g7192 [Zizania palustris]